jgi:hypothetical protein
MEGFNAPMPPHPNVIIYKYGGIRGPGYHFASRLADQTEKPVIFIDASIGGTSISQWQGYWQWLVDAAKETNRPVVAFLFYQGEQDANYSYQVQWASQFGNIVSGIRDGLNSPLLPVIFAQIGQWGSGPTPSNVDWIRQEQANVNIPGVSMVQTLDLVPGCGGWHHCTDTATVIGDRMFSLYP